jgi:hypothetical protein
MKELAMHQWAEEQSKASLEVLDLDRRTDINYHAGFGEKLRVADSKSQVDLELPVK